MKVKRLFLAKVILKKRLKRYWKEYAAQSGKHYAMRVSIPID